MFVNLREKILAWTGIRTRVSSFMGWRSNQLSYTGGDKLELFFFHLN